MLLSLTIRDLVLIDRLQLTFSPNLSVLTGETGAGKSILLDGLGLALGFRAESGLVRTSAQQAVVVAEFDIVGVPGIMPVLTDQGIDADNTLVFRRVLGADGRSRAFVNDQPVSVGLLKQLGEQLVEIQGQFEQRGLMDPFVQRSLLDAFMREAAAVGTVWTHWNVWRTTRASHEAAAAAYAKATADEDYLRHAVAELDALKPQPGEEAALAERRQYLSHRAQIFEAISNAHEQLGGERGAERSLNAAARVLERIREKAGGSLDPAIAAIERALVETVEAVALIDTVGEDSDGLSDLDAVEARLFELRAMARKHGVLIDGLAELRNDYARHLSAIEDGGEGVRILASDEIKARARYIADGEKLSKLRRAAAIKLDKAVMAELPPLRLERATFKTSITPLPEAEWNAHGMERISFDIATNPGTPPAPLGKIASGGELSRFLLALKVALAGVSSIPTLVFDEVDSGIGGAVAAAVGERLQRLGRDLQVLVVTHSPQVAARGEQHWRIVKHQAENAATTQVEALDTAERREEIARMLSGAEVTDAARAAADTLLRAALTHA